MRGFQGLDELERRLHVLGGHEELVVGERGHATDLAVQRARVSHRLDDVARARLSCRISKGEVSRFNENEELLSSDLWVKNLISSTKV